MILSKITDILKNVSEFVNKCLGPLGTEGFSWSQIRDVLIQLCATLILFILVRFLLWKPITRIIEKRREVIDKELEEAKESNNNARKLASDAQIKYDEAHIKIKQMLDKAEKDANLRKDEIIKQAKDEAKRRLDVLEEEIALEIQNANEEIKKQIVDIAMTAASKIIEKEVDQDKYINLVNEIFEEASK